MARPSRPWYWEGRNAWYVTVKGKRRRLAEGPKARTKAAADQEFHRLMLAEGRAVETERSRMTVDDVFDLFLVQIESEAKREERTAKSLRYYQKILLSASGSFGGAKATELLPRDALRWADRDSWGPSCRRLALSVTHAAFAWAKKTGHLAANPLEGLEMPRMGVREAIPTHEQVAAMLGAARGEAFRELLVALRDTGCRPSEVMTLTADRVDLESGTWEVSNKTRRKTGRKTRTVYLTPEMIALSRKLTERNPDGCVFRNSQGGPWTEKAVGSRFERLRGRLKYGPECTAYAFRHLYITDALERGVNPATVAELVGHTSLNMIMRYYNKLRHRTNHLREAARVARPPS